MTANEAVDLGRWIPTDKIQKADVFKVAQIIRRAKEGIKPDRIEAEFLSNVYRYTNGGGDLQEQPFKQYRRKKSWGV